MLDSHEQMDGRERAVQIAVSGPAVDTDTDAPVESLRRWLADEDEVRGWLRSTPTPPGPGELGTLTEVLTIVLAPGGVAAVLAGAIVSWVRWHRSDLRIRLRRGNGDEVELEVTRLRGLTPDDLPAAVETLRQWMDSGPAGPDAVLDDVRADSDNNVARADY